MEMEEEGEREGEGEGARARERLKEETRESSRSQIHNTKMFLSESPSAISNNTLLTLCLLGKHRPFIYVPCL